MKIKLSELENGVSGVYKLTYPNGKIYIGISNDIKRRMYEHNNTKRLNTHFNAPCDLAILKYGKFEEIEILEKTNDPQELNEKEKYWISYYHSNEKDKGYNLTCGGKALYGENHPRAKFTNEEVLDIRKRKFNGERKIDVYQDYKDRKFSTFEGVWLGRKYVNIGKEYFISKSSAEISSIVNAGENNSHSKLTKQDVLDIRNRYDNLNQTVVEIAKDYNFVNIQTIRRVCKRETWKNV